MTKIILAFETSSSVCSAAIWGEGEVMAHEQESIGYGHASSLFNFVRNVSQKARVPLEYISHVAVTRGPGSFTGVRVGLAAARGFSLAGNLPVLGMTTFDLLAFMAKKHMKKDGPKIVAMDTKRQDFYTAFYDGKKDQPSHVKIMKPEDLQAHVEPYKKSYTPVHVIGDGAATLETEYKWPLNVEFMPLLPNAGELAEAAAFYSTKDTYPFSSDPFYLRPPKVYE
jgi:tRNA threonylcarbamoyladenosine biosynthesis protein TsaB